MYNIIIDGCDRRAPFVIISETNYYPKHDDDGRNLLARAQSSLAWWSCSTTCSSPSTLN